MADSQERDEKEKVASIHRIVEDMVTADEAEGENSSHKLPWETGDEDDDAVGSLTGFRKKLAAMLKISKDKDDKTDEDGGGMPRSISLTNLRRMSLFDAKKPKPLKRSSSTSTALTITCVFCKHANPRTRKRCENCGLDLEPTDHVTPSTMSSAYSRHYMSVEEKPPSRSLLASTRARKIRQRVNFIEKTLKAVSHVAVYAMLELDTVGLDNKLRDTDKLTDRLKALKECGATGVMADVWWGLVETKPREYDFSAYVDLVKLVKDLDLKIQFVASFHKCGGNVGDAVTIPLPKFVLDIGKENSDIFYKDPSGRANDEYLSWGVDLEPLFPPENRTAVQMYEDFLSALVDAMGHEWGTTITQIQVGLGPAGEMRYPAYPLSFGWEFPGVGQFQCYDKYLKADLDKHAKERGHPEWNGAPGDAGSYNSLPNETSFFHKQNGGWNSDYGRYFLGWYSSRLIAHGDRILGMADQLLKSKLGERAHEVSIAAKIAGIHWWYDTPSHAPELTAGYYNTIHHNGYRDIAEMFKKHHAHFDFTCLEMKNKDIGRTDWKCNPENLVLQTAAAAEEFGVDYSGENALARFDDEAYRQMIFQIYRTNAKALTYLRVSDDLFEDENLESFGRFCRALAALNRDLVEMLLLDWF
mmetsp:Transcript_14462/g.23927  ORF Transcript_14462/g.23927 Transcript_14462/m.23927 type:complete len:641 (+) Transcript_14462:141-2063(+)|eukprot:CAMPEP_0184671676 /NCGR_PEP_ID=MMETSP0308-20130426/85642_1 /TAXON_ID=38269 /ORGANISM="Gloeochaete witrockiana, Strain SAG 46.84" /LENGTH=640 /DNA_ID=CAMNT_0027118847 /DNA_START=80 /DNA_END=2002 /DNA_ORIENTATION=+